MSERTVETDAQQHRRFLWRVLPFVFLGSLLGGLVVKAVQPAEPWDLVTTTGTCLVVVAVGMTALHRRH